LGFGTTGVESSSSSSAANDSFPLAIFFVFFTFGSDFEILHLDSQLRPKRVWLRNVLSYWSSSKALLRLVCEGSTVEVGGVAIALPWLLEVKREFKDDESIVTVVLLTLITDQKYKSRRKAAFVRDS
jgi:hypothetical protein